MSIVQPLILNATSTVLEGREIVANAHELRWVVVRGERGFDVKWYLFRLANVLSLMADSPDDMDIGTAVGIATARAEAVVQLADLETDDFVREGVKVVLDGSRFLGIIEPLLMSANGGRRTRGARSKRRSGAAALPARAEVTAPAPARPESTSEAVALDAQAYIDAPATVRGGDAFTLTIGLSDRPTPGVSGAGVHVEFEAGVDLLPLDIEVLAPEFVCERGWRHTINIQRDDPFAERLQLPLIAPSLAANAESRVSTITVFYSHEGSHCGTASRRILVQREAAASDESAPPTVASPVSIASAAEPIDLTVRIAWRDDNEATNTLDWTFVTPHAVGLPAGPLSKTVSLGAATFARRLLTDVTANDAADGIDVLLDGIGGQIADVVPPGVWPILESVSTAVRSARGPAALVRLLLLTQESQVPWELALLPTPLDPKRPGFLATQCVVSRWVLDAAAAQPVPPARLKVGDMAVIVGEYQAGGNFAALPNAQVEGTQLKAKHGAESFSATRESVLGVLRCQLPVLPADRAGVEAIHFACHGETERADAAASSIILNDGTTISPSFFRKAPVAERSHPFVFLNACQVGAGAASLGQYGGFAGICIRAGCSGVVAPLWSVNDVIARDFALAFYDLTFARPASGRNAISVAEAVNSLRQRHLAPIKVKVKQPDGTEIEEERLTATPLAYVVYGHPGLILDRD